MYQYLSSHFSPSGKYVNGWFLRLCYGLHYMKESYIDDIQLNPIYTQFRVIDDITKESKICSVVGGFHGVESCDGRHKPVMSLAIIDG
jgi:hypothetical protein